MAALLISTTGISVQQIYCYCVGETTYALFLDAADACDAGATEAGAACCKNAAPGCCTPPADGKPEQTHGCTQKSVRVIQLDADFLVGHSSEKLFDCPAWAEEVPEYLRWFAPAICLNKNATEPAPPAPPPLSGREICLRYEIFRC